MEHITRKVLSHIFTIHLFVALALFALFGFIMTNNKFLLLFVALSFSGAVCGSFIRVIDEIRKTSK